MREIRGVKHLGREAVGCPAGDDGVARSGESGKTRVVVEWPAARSTNCPALDKAGHSVQVDRPQTRTEGQQVPSKP